MDPALLLGHLPRPILVLGRDMTVRLANAAFAGLLGAAGADATAVSALVRGESFLALALAKAMARLRVVGRSTEFRWSPSGEHAATFHVEVTCTDEDVFIAIFDPISEQVTLEEIHSETRTYLEAVLNHLDVGVLVLDPRFCVTFINRTQIPLLALCGVDQSMLDLIGGPVAASLPLLSLEQWADVHARVVERGETVTFEKVAYPATSPSHYFQMRIVPLSLGGALGGICITEDITRLVTLESELVRNERMALVGQMAIALNHEINNPLLVVIGSAESLLMSGTLDQPTVDSLQAIVESGQRIARVTHRLRKIEQIQLTEYVKDGPMMLDLRLLDET